MDDVKKVGIHLDEEELKEVSGGFGGKNPDDSCWIYGTVHGVVHYDSSSCLTLRNVPDGDVMYTPDGKIMGWQNGESALVQPSSRTGDFIRANWNGTIGWTKATYIWY